MRDSYVESRLEFLRRSQNPDGGWGYFPGKQSWMEPTVYAMLALGYPRRDAAIDSALQRSRTWRRPDGSWRPGEQVFDSTWVTALGILLEPEAASVRWLMGVSGQESRLIVRLASFFHFLKTDVNVNHRGWPWRPGNSAWVEPTALTLLALKKAGSGKADAAIRARLLEGEELLFSRRGRDGGWSAGNPNVLNVDVPSYPETTAIALIGLQGRRTEDLAGPLAVARGYYQDRQPALASAWLQIALRCYGDSPRPPMENVGALSDIYLCSLQAIGHPDGNHQFFRCGGRA